ncbi:MAG: hypothetical protein M3Z30_13475 [Gemmatimonadota bacterium]|nr:hypothetical protein [Gemmatimonadota bacterium]
MKFFGSRPTPAFESGFQPELRVVEYIATRKGESERGPQVRLAAVDARFRVLADGELAWVRGVRGQYLAEVAIDDRFAQHTCGLRDVPGILAAESVRVVKPDLDTPERKLV